MTGSVFVSNSYDNTVSVIDGGTNARIATLPVGASPFGLAVDSSLGKAYVANRASNDVTAVPDPK